METSALPPEIVDDFHDLISVEVTKIDRQTQKEMSEAIFEATRRGMLISSSAMGSVVEVAGNSLERHAQAALDILLRSLAAHGSAVDNKTKPAVRFLLAESVNEQVARLKAMTQDTAPFKSGQISGRANLLSRLDEVAELEIRRVSVEISLIAARNRVPPPALPSGTKSYIDPARIAALQAIRRGPWDFTRLVELCREINVAADNRCYMSTAMLLRTILNHVPPVLGFKTFAEVANNYGDPKAQRSFKASMQRLEGSLRNIADMHLHSPIRSREDVPTAVQVEFAADLDVLLGEVIRLGRDD